MRVGIGYDIHRFAPGRELVLGGVHISGSPGLEGHSDADVLVHALMDALLGAAGERDIGYHFPNDDPRYAGVSSLFLLEKVVSMLTDNGYSIQNVDCTIVAEAPRLASYIEPIRETLAGVMRIEKDRVGLKATTNEMLGALGRREGIAAVAVALIDEEAKQ